MEFIGLFQYFSAISLGIIAVARWAKCSTKGVKGLLNFRTIAVLFKTVISLIIGLPLESLNNILPIGDILIDLSKLALTSQASSFLPL